MSIGERFRYAHSILKFYTIVSRFPKERKGSSGMEMSEWPAITPQMVSSGAMAVTRDFASPLAQSPLVQPAGPTPSAGPQVISNAPSSANSQSNSTSSEIHRHLVNIAIVRLHEFHDLISMRMLGSTLEYRRMALADYFSPTSMLSVSYNLGPAPCHYTFSYCLVPHLSAEMARGDSKVDINCKLVKAKILQDGSTSLESPQLMVVNTFPDGSQMVHRGTLKVHINPDLRIERYDMIFEHKQVMIDAASQIPPNGSMAMAKHITQYGISEWTLRMLKMGDVMSMLKPMMIFHNQSGNDSPLTSFDNFAAGLPNTYLQQQPQPQQPPQPQQQPQQQQQQQMQLQPQPYLQQRYAHPMQPQPAQLHQQLPQQQLPPQQTKVMAKTNTGMNMNVNPSANLNINGMNMNSMNMQSLPQEQGISPRTTSH